MKVNTINATTFEIRHKDGIKTMTAKLICANRAKNIMVWQFKSKNGAIKYFDMFDQGLEFYAKKGW